MEWYHVCWPRLTAKRVEPVVSISWASCYLRDTVISAVLATATCLDGWLGGWIDKLSRLIDLNLLIGSSRKLSLLSPLNPLTLSHRLNPLNTFNRFNAINGFSGFNYSVFCQVGPQWVAAGSTEPIPSICESNWNLCMPPVTDITLVFFYSRLMNEDEATVASVYDRSSTRWVSFKFGKMYSLQLILSFASD